MPSIVRSLLGLTAASSIREAAQEIVSKIVGVGKRELAIIEKV
jgi:hypothetical protein